MPYVTPTLGLDILIIKPLAALFLSIGGIDLLKHLMPALRTGGEILSLLICICMVAAVYLLILTTFGVWKVIQFSKRSRWL